VSTTTPELSRAPDLAAYGLGQTKIKRNGKRGNKIKKSETWSLNWLEHTERRRQIPRSPVLVFPFFFFYHRLPGQLNKTHEMERPKRIKTRKRKKSKKYYGII